MEFSEAEMWFTDLWNYSIVPYLLEAVRDEIQVRPSTFLLLQLIFYHFPCKALLTFM